MDSSAAMPQRRVKQSHGWYDVTVTADRDATWSQRLVGHLETGRPSVSG